MRRSFTTTWIAVLLAASITGALAPRFEMWISLAPDRIWRGELWRLVTWGFVAHEPRGLILTCIAIYVLGGSLEAAWGGRRLRRFALQIITGAGVAAWLLATLLGHTWLRRCSGVAVCDMLVIAWARQFPQRELIFYWLLRLRGRNLVRVTIAATCLAAIFYGPIVCLPELAAGAAAALYPTGWLRG